MARRLRLQFSGAMYHVINRGNYRRDLFEAEVTAYAFEAVLGDACRRFGWQLHAFVVMRNHFHLALTTLEPNLVEGMHWLQTTFAVRFNRYRSENGHLFQGRYHALLVEDRFALGRVVDYIHLNPVRAGRVPIDAVGSCAHSSLRAFLAKDRPDFLVAAGWMSAIGLTETSDGWAKYLGRLRDLAGEAQQAGNDRSAGFSRGWAIGTHAWKQAIARELRHHALEIGYAAAEIRDINEARWGELLDAELMRAGRSRRDAARASRGARWRVVIARRLRDQGGVPYAWIASQLQMGPAASVRVAVYRDRSCFPDSV